MFCRARLRHVFKFAPHDDFHEYSFNDLYKLFRVNVFLSNDFMFVDEKCRQAIV